MAYTIIDMARYPRRAHFDYFRSLAYPYVGVTAEADVTDLVRQCRSRGRSFYLMFLHAAALAANDVPELRQRIRGNGIIEYDECPTSHVEPLPDGAYTYCTLRHRMPVEEYLLQAAAAREACRTRAVLQEDADVDRMLFISTLPWLHYTALIQPVAAGDESNPRITWGRFTENAAGRLTLPVSILAHHALADGAHIARFYEALDARIPECAGM